MQPTFIDNIVSLSKSKWRKINEKIIESLQEYYTDPNFKEEIIRRDSVSASKVCAWLCSIIEFHNIHKEIEEAREEIRERSSEMMLLQSKLDQK